MLDPDTFLTILYVTVDDFFQSEDAPPAPPPKPERPASLSRRETVTLGLFGQWFGFGGERGFGVGPAAICARPFRACLPASRSTACFAPPRRSWRALRWLWPKNSARRLPPLKPWIPPAR
jgi:hypothetical protein